MTSTLTQRLQRAVALRNAATAGEWRRDAMGGSSTVLTQAKPGRNDNRIPTYGYRDNGEHCIGYPFIEDDGRIRRDFICLSHEDAAFIAAAPSIVQLAVELGAEVGRLEHRLQSGGYCAFCETTVAPLPGFLLSHVMRGHVESCEKHPLGQERARVAELEAALRRIVDRDLGYLGGYVAALQIDARDIYLGRQALSGASENG